MCFKIFFIVNLNQLDNEIYDASTTNDMQLNKFLKPLSYLEIGNNHEKIVNKDYKFFNNSIEIIKDLDKAKVPLLEDIYQLRENKIMDGFIQKKINEIDVVRRLFF